jgi:polar amino acid transport system permease protein
MNYSWDFDIISRSWDLLLLGLLNSIYLTAASFVLGLPLGLALALARLSRHKMLAGVASGYVDFFRATPSLVLLYWFYFALPRILSIQIEPFTAALVTLTLLSSAFVAEVFRAGIASLDRGQWDGARAIGMSYPQTMRRVILPQAIKRMIPIFLERAIELFKTSTIASVISFPELLFVAQDLASRSYRSLEVYTVVALMFVITLIVLSQITRLIELRLARSGETTTS